MTPAASRHIVVVGLTGSTGAIYGIRLLEALREVDSHLVHLIVSPAARRTIAHETDSTIERVAELADVVHRYRDIGASLASGSFLFESMLVVPCTMKTLGAIVHSYADNLIVRAADVALKERRPLVLAVRETPLHVGHLRLMASASELGAIVMPPMPAFYHRPRTLDDIVDQTVGRLLDEVGLRWRGVKRWEGMGEEGRVGLP